MHDDPSQRLLHLAHASKLFAEAISDERALLDAVAEQVSRVTGDGCTVRLLSADGLMLEPVAVHHPDPDLRSAMAEVGRKGTQRADIGVWKSVIEDRRRIRTPVSADHLPPDASPEQIAFIRRFPVRHILLIPLVARGRVIGGVALARYVDAPHSIDDERFLGDLADRAAMAIDNARLISSERRARETAERAEAKLREVELRALEVELARQQDMFERFFSLSLDLMVVAGIDGYIRRASRGFEALGYGEEELRARPFLDFVHPDDRAGAEAEVALLAQGIPTARFECRVRLADGSHRWFWWTAAADAEGLLFAMARDMTDARHADAAGARLAAIVSSSEDAIIAKSPDGIITSWNAGAELMFGYTEGEAVGRSMTMLIPDDRKSEEPRIMERLRRGERVDHFETVRLRKDGREVQISVSISPLKDSAGRLIGASNISRDISHLVESQQALVRAKDEAEMANRELESFSYSVAHDLRAPLRSIDGFSQALLEDYAEKLDDGGRKYLGLVRGSAQRMAKLIDDLLSLSRVTRSELGRERVDLSALARAAYARLASAASPRRVEVLIEDGVFADADPRLLAVVLDNLLGNAWKFTSKRDAGRIELGRTSNGGAPTYYVRDNGAGFDMAYAGKLFGVFQRLHSTAEFEGTGIGLATVQRIARRHGGRAWAEGEVGVGATFFFTLGEGAS